jgi:hypothetical protein
MQAEHLEVKRASSKLGAILDIKRRAEAGWKTYSATKRKDAAAIRKELQDVYSAKVYEANPRDTFIAVKVVGENPRVKTRAGLDKLEARLESKGVTKVTTNQGIIYRIPR